MARLPRLRPRPTRPDGLLVRFWGVRGSVAVPGPTTLRYGGNTSCVEVRTGREIIILDAGTGIRELGKQLVREFSKRSARLSILITHTHWDHIQGFPFFAPAYLARHRIRILGWRGSHAGLRRTVASAVESPFFPVGLKQMPGTITVEEMGRSDLNLGTLRCRAALLNHPGGGVAFRIDTPHGSLAYVPDHEVPFKPGTPISGNGEPLMGRARSRDAGVCELISGVDLLIHDAQYTAEEYATRAGWGHSCVDAVIGMAARCRVKRLVLFHHDPNRTDDEMDVILARARAQASLLQPSIHIDAAREGMELHLRRSQRGQVTIFDKFPDLFHR
jgi:phosphoribosyl 1,2-cyclic phosphodiesterase